MNYLLDAALFLVLTVSLVVAGWCLWSPSRSSFEAGFVPGAALLGLWGWLIWVVGSFKLVPIFWAVLPWPLLLILVLWKRVNLGIHAKGTFSGLKKLKWDERTAVFYLLFLFAITFCLTLAPPNGADYDSLTYHLAIPAQYLRAGRVLQLSYDHHSYFPFTFEMLYAVALGVRGAVFAKLFHWLMLPVGAFALIAIGKRAHSTRAGLLAACLYASMPMVLEEATTAYIDLGFAAFAFLAVLCFCGAPSRSRGENWIWSGAFCGFCLGSKYFGWLFLGFLGIWLLLGNFRLKAKPIEDRVSWRRVLVFAVPTLCFGAFCGLYLGWKYFGCLVLGIQGIWLLFGNFRLEVKPIDARVPWSYVLAFAVPALVFGVPWYLRNALWTGNPVFPFAYSIFGGSGWTSEMAVKYDESQAIYGFGKSLPDLILLPWRLAMTPLSAGIFNGGVKGQPFWPLIPGPASGTQTGIFEVPGLFINIFPGPALFALGIPAYFIKGKPREITLCAWFFGFLWLFWAVTSQQVRYLLPALGLLALVAGWGVAVLAPRLKIARTIGTLALVAWFVFAPLLTLSHAQSTFPVILGAMSSDEYLRRTFPGYDAMNYANGNTPKDAQFAVYGEPRCFYLDRSYFWADSAHNTLVDYTKLKDGSELARALRGLGATYVLCNFDAAHNGGAFSPPQPLTDDAIAHNNFSLVYEARGYRIYRIVTS